MTARLIWEGMLTELSKVNAPSLLLLDFNYFINKAINQYINKRYNIYDVNQQTTDDLRVLKATEVLTPIQVGLGGAANSKIADRYAATYEVIFPYDYLHLLNCICIYKVHKNYKCYNLGDFVEFPAKRLTADSWSMVISDYFNRPLPQRPYYYIHNVNNSIEEPTNLYNNNTLSGVDQNSDIYQTIQITEDTKKVLNKVNTLNAVVIKIPHNESTLSLSKDPKYPGYVIDKFLYNILVEEVGLDNYVTGNFGQNYLLRCYESSVDLAYFKVVNKADPSECELFYISAQDGFVYMLGIDDIYQISEKALDVTEIQLTSEYPRTINLVNLQLNVSLIDKPAYLRHSNLSLVRCEIRYGKDNSVFELVEVMIDYIKSPQHIRLTQEQVDMTIDTSLVMEFPDYVCLEIINELTILVMENTSNPRLLTNAIVTQSIALPAQQLTPKITKSAKAD